MTKIERLAVEDYAPRKNLQYVDILSLHQLYEKIAFRGNHILVGPKGIAKTMSVAAYAAKIDCPIITFDCSEDVRRSHLLGMPVLRGDETPFVLGPVTSAFEVANEAGRCILCFEEINALTPQCQKLLNPATDFRRRVEVPEALRVFELKPKAKLWVVGTMNFSVYSGVYMLNEDLKSRFRMVPCDYPGPAQERSVLEELLQDLNLQDRYIELAVTLAGETRTGAMEYALSTRDIVQILEDIVLLGVPEALRIASGKFEGSDLAAFKQRVKSTFGADVDAPRGQIRHEGNDDEVIDF
jgi:nitric oxide reductase NorQ protein